MAECIDSNIREMEGLLNRVIFLSKLEERKLSIELVKEALRDSGEAPDTSVSVTVDDIINVVCQRFNVSRGELEGKKRTKEIVEPRHICMYLIAELLDLPYTTIGNILGGRDHTTVIHSKEKIAEKVATTPRMRNMIFDLKDLLFRKQPPKDQ